MARIAVIFHKLDTHPGFYVIDELADIWRSDGHEVVFCFGVDEALSADLAIAHVNLSVVPSEYLEYSGNVGVALNFDIGDIRKSSISEQMVASHPGWSGPVIVKSNLNYGGIPEKRISTAVDQTTRAPDSFLAKCIERVKRLAPTRAQLPQYRIFKSAASVPRRLSNREDLVIEKFLPERVRDSYCVRTAQCLGDRWICYRLHSKSPIVKSGVAHFKERIEPDDAVREWRNRFRLDYGKLDYVVHDNQPVLLDVNKTIGNSAPEHAPSEHLKERRYLAEGLYSYLERGQTPLAGN